MAHPTGECGLKQLEAQKRYYEQELEKNHAQWSALSSKKVGAQFCAGGGALIFISSLLGKTNPLISGALALIVSAVGAIWWWDLKRQMDELIRRSMRLNDALVSVEERFYEP